MSVNLDYYRTFYYVAEFGGITAAAGRLYLSQPAVSQTIQILEKTLGCTLFLRTSRGMTLTREGEILFRHVKSGYEQLLQGERELHNYLKLDRGELRIGASDMTLQFYLLPCLEKFYRSFPGIKVYVTNGPTPATLEALARGEIDFCVVSGPLEEQKEFAVYPVAEIRDTFVAGSEYASLRGQILPWRILEKYPIICLEKATSTRNYVDRFLEKRGIVLNPEFELATSDLILQFAQRNLGIGSVVRSFYEKGNADGIFELQFEDPIPPRQFFLVAGKNVPVSPAGREMLRMLMGEI